MDVTLRTLLNWIDGTLPPDEREHVAARLARSRSAKKFEARIRAAVALDACGALPVDAWGTADDANRVAEYLDDRLPEPRFHRFERECLESEAHLGEVGACHGLLSESGGGSAAVAAFDAEILTRLKERGRRLLPRGRKTSALPAPVPAASPAASPPVVHPSPPTTPATRPMPAAAASAGPKRSHETSSAAASLALDQLAWMVAHHHRETVPSTGLAPMPVAAAPVPAAGQPAQEPPGGERASWWSWPKRSDDGDDDDAVEAESQSRTSWSLKLGQAGIIVVLAGVVGFFVMRANAPDTRSGPQRAAVQGQVTLDGKPLETGVISLVPVGDTEGPVAGGQLSQGRFLIKASAGPVLGRYRVEIQSRRSSARPGKPQPPVGPRKRGQSLGPEQIVPARYNTESQLEIEIKPGRNLVTFDLISPPKSS